MRGRRRETLTEIESVIEKVATDFAALSASPDPGDASPPLVRCLVCRIGQATFSHGPNLSTYYAERRAASDSRP